MKKKYKEVHHTLWNAILRNKLEIKKVDCNRCGSTKFLVYHHPDYKKPYEVEIICKSCHSKIHKVIKNFKEKWKIMPRNKYGLFGKKKYFGKFKCVRCNKIYRRYNARQERCHKCSVIYNTIERRTNK